VAGISAPLIKRRAQDKIAYVNQSLASLNYYHGSVTGQQFLSHVKQLASMLPDHAYAINLCANRYLFMVSLCAVIVRKQTNLLPPNINTATQAALQARYTDSYIIYDGFASIIDMPQFNVSHVTFDPDDESFDIPMVALDHLAVISFTSGSTGDSKPSYKTWHTLTASTEINRKYMVPNESDTFYQLATVPGQHMWGLETSILLALLANVCVVDSKPLFPQDIQDVLSALPSPRMLVSTPVHLRALIAGSLDYACVDAVLCATSPLSKDLAQQVETRFSAKLREVYGCSEIGSMAVRCTAHQDEWTRFEGIFFTVQADQKVMASAEYIADAVELQDHVVMINESQFNLVGRLTDMVNIAGKRGSLHEVNQVLQTFPGLLDGIVFFPPQERSVPRLVALVVLSEGIDKQKLTGHFRRYLDSAFVPRPIIIVAALPREENGKLPQKKLLAFYQGLSKSK